MDHPPFQSVSPLSPTELGPPVTKIDPDSPAQLRCQQGAHGRLAPCHYRKSNDPVPDARLASTGTGDWRSPIPDAIDAFHHGYDGVNVPWSFNVAVAEDISA